MIVRPSVRDRSLAAIASALAALVLASCSARTSSAPHPEDSESAGECLAPQIRTPDPRVPRVARIPSGTVIESVAPEGWTHLIDKSKPKLETGDVERVPEKFKQLSGLFFTAMIARVKPAAGRAHAGFVLDEVAINLGTRIGDHDTIITPETQDKLGAGLGFLGRIALDQGSECIDNVRLAARTPTMALIDGPAIMLRDKKHKPAVVRYAILVDSETGKLETLLWAIAVDDQGAYEGMVGCCEWLGPNHLEDRHMHVDAEEFTFGLVTQNALAMDRLFKGHTQFQFAPELEALAEQARVRPESAAELEQALRKLLRSPSAH